MRRSPRDAEGIGIESKRTRYRPGQPVESERRDQLVLGEAALDVSVAVAPAGAAVQHPCGEPDRRVLQRPTDCLRFPHVREEVRHVQGRIALAVIVFDFFRGEVFAAERGIGAEQGGIGEVTADESVGVFVGELRGDEGSRIAAVGAESSIAELSHQLDPQTRCLPPTDTGRRRRREHGSGQRGHDDVKAILGVTTKPFRVG